MARRMIGLLARVLAGISAFAFATGSASAEDWDKVVEAARQEGSLAVYVGINSSLTQKVAEAFEEKFGINVDVLEGRPTEIRERIRSELATGKPIADVSYNGSTSSQLQFADGFFQPHGDIPNMSKISPDFTLDGTLVPAQISTFGILANTAMVSEAELPKSWRDLLDPKWKGKILMDDPRTFGGGAIFFGVTHEKLGADFHEKLVAQAPVFARGYAESERRVSRGEFAFFIPDTMTSYAALKGLPVKLLLPEEGNPYIVSTLALVKDAPHPNAAKLFINYFLDEESLPKFGELGFSGPIPGMSASAPEDARPYLAPKLLGTLDGSQIEKVIETAKSIYK